MKKKKPWKIVWVSDSKVRESSYKLIKKLFGIDAIYISNIASLYDYVDRPVSRRKLLERVEKKYKISMHNFPNDDLYVWEVAKFVKEKLEIKLAELEPN